MYKELVSVDGLDDVLKLPLAVVFKHSTKCAVSGMAFSEFRLAEDESKTPFFLVKIIEHRDVSDALTKKLKQTHESPQLFIIKKGKVVFEASHDLITKDSILKNI